MHPVLIDFGTWDLPGLGPTPIFLPTYGVLFAASVVLCWLWFMRRIRTPGVDPDVLFNLGFYAVLAGIIGAKVLLLLVDWRLYLDNPRLILGTLRSAGVLVGGVIGGALAFVVYCRKHDLPTWRFADALAAPLALAQAIGRLGCWTAGCCWGRTVDADHPLAVVFTDPRAGAQTGVPLHTPLFPTQLVQMTADLVLCVILAVFWQRRPEPPGTVFWTYVLLYGLSRGTIELWRGDTTRGLWLGVSTSQWFAAFGILVAIHMLWRGRRLRRQPA